jgi:hypothetical protein
MVDDRNRLPSLEYWRTPQQRAPQRFYMAFCLLMSGTQDWILGLKERESQNLNWSATCSYYSLVHGGRLLCFLALGDYPKFHGPLRDLMNARTRKDRQAYSDGYPFDWLRGFTSIADDGRQARKVPGEGWALVDLRQMIAAYLETIEVADASRRLDEFGKVFRAAGPLRNDSNYEALLIANEFRHVVMTDAFDSLSQGMARAAEASLPLFIDTFNGFLRRDPDLPEDRRAYQSFLHEYLHSRLGDAMHRKLAGTQALEIRLRDMATRIETLDIAEPFDEIERQIAMDVFGNKTRLMSEFMSRIGHLETLTGDSSQEGI